uniref:Uncharacterized protein n=1 Tax=Anguilla anguilla TaxID=7936 RepID=A0A0E9RMV2_ANGAN
MKKEVGEKHAWLKSTI